MKKEKLIDGFAWRVAAWGVTKHDVPSIEDTMAAIHHTVAVNEDQFSNDDKDVLDKEEAADISIFTDADGAAYRWVDFYSTRGVFAKINFFPADGYESWHRVNYSRVILKDQ